MRYTTILTIAGSDSCGGAGIQADLKTISAMGGYACSAITAITAQNTMGVRSIQGCDPIVLKDQIEAVFEDMTIDAVKSGMLYSKENVEVITACLTKYKPQHYVLDPVMISTSGSRLITEEAIDAIKTQLFPLASLVTPNIPEAEALTGLHIGSPDDMPKAANEILKTGCKAVLIKGGHLPGNETVDMLFEQGKDGIGVRTPFVDTQNTHGTGCTLSSAIATRLALGDELRDAFVEARNYIIHTLYNGKDVKQGHGHGPVNHFFHPQPLHKVEE